MLQKLPKKPAGYEKKKKGRRFWVYSKFKTKTFLSES